MSNPFELRFQIFNEAKEYLNRRYEMQRDDILCKFYSEEGAGKNPEFPDLPEFPSFREIKNLADDIKSFVAEK